MNDDNEDTKRAMEVVKRIDCELHLAAEECGAAHTALGALHSSMSFAMHCAPTHVAGMNMIIHVMHHIINNYDNDDDE